MGIVEILAGLVHGKSGRDGVWDFLGKRSADKARLELERTRNDGTQKVIPLLPPGTVLIEGGPDWFREIRIPEALPPGTPLNAITSRSPIPPLPAPRNELEAAPPTERRRRQTIPADEETRRGPRSSASNNCG
jgi:hypothetical protein